MSLQRLRTFIEVFRQRSISGAARSLGLTQPGVSQHIAGLESTIGRQLFERLPSGVLPTSAAEELAAQIGDALDTAEAALAMVRARSDEMAGAINIAGHGDFLAEVVAPTLIPLLEMGMRMRLHGGNHAMIEETLIAGHCDLGISAFPVHDRRLRSEEIARIPMIAVASPVVAARLAKADDLAASLTREPLIAYSVERPVVDDWLAFNGMSAAALPPPAAAGQDLRGICRLLREGFGWSVIPDYICGPYLASGELKEIEPPVGHVMQPYFLIWTPSVLREPRIAHARQTLIWSLRQKNERRHLA